MISLKRIIESLVLEGEKIGYNVFKVKFSVKTNDVNDALNFGVKVRDTA